MPGAIDKPRHVLIFKARFSQRKGKKRSLLKYSQPFALKGKYLKLTAAARG